MLMLKIYAEPGGYDRVDLSEQIAAQAVELLTLRGQLSAAEKKVEVLREERDRASERARKNSDDAQDATVVLEKLRGFRREVEDGLPDGQVSKRNLLSVMARLLDSRHFGPVAQPSCYCYCDGCRR